MSLCKALSRFFGVARRTVLRWQAAGCDLTDPDAVARFVKGLSRPSSGVSAEIHRGRLVERLAEALEPSLEALQAAQVHRAVREQKTLREIELLEIKIEKVRGELVSRAEMRELGQKAGALLESELGALAQDLPAQLARADEVTIRERLETRVVALVNRLRDALGKINSGDLES